MTSEFVIGLVVGGLGVLVIVGAFAGHRLAVQRRRHRLDVDERDTALVELRHELADDKETNRRLRHELAVMTPGNLLETATTAEMERNGALSERDQALEQLELVERDLAQARSRLAQQEARLRRYREGLQEIRLSLEARGQPRESLDGATAMFDTDELPTALHQEPVGVDPVGGFGPVEAEPGVERVGEVEEHSAVDVGGAGD